MSVEVTTTQPRVEMTPSGPNVLTVGLQGPPGPPGPPGNVLAPINFAWGDATPVTIHTLAEASIIVEVAVIFRTPFNGIGASLKIGTSLVTDLLMAADQNAPALASQFSTNPGVELPTATHLVLTLVPGVGATQGNGVILFTVTPIS